MALSALLTVSLYATIGSSTPFNDVISRPTATIDSGALVGTAVVEPSSKATVVKYLGVPFGAPPKRFSSPKKPDPWKTPYDASNYKPACIQKFDYPEENRKQIMEWFNNPPSIAGESEDCLNLNVYAPASTENDLKPVLFWLYGGAFNFGTGSLPLYDGTSFAANQDIVVVTSNYRTNVFGFPGSPDIKKSEQNLGWLDQRLALDWVQRNIAALGGDPNKVTIVGESAGAGSVDALVTTPPNPTPFRGAIMQSGQGSILMPNNDSATSWEALAKFAGCPEGGSLKCLREIPAEKLKSLVEHEALHFGPAHDDGTTWAEDPRKARLSSTASSSSIARVPVLIGSNSDEGLTFVWGINDTRKYIHDTWPEITNKIIDIALKLYPVGSHGIFDDFLQLSMINTEFSMQCPAKTLADDNKNVGIKTWRYYFNASFPNTEIFKDSGAWHSSEIGLVFGTYPRVGATQFQVKLSQNMQRAWAGFIKDPTKGPGWDHVPKLAVIGGGVRGGNDTASTIKPIKTMNPWLLDIRCWLFEGLFDKITGLYNARSSKSAWKFTKHRGT